MTLILIATAMVGQHVCRPGVACGHRQYAPAYTPTYQAQAYAPNTYHAPAITYGAVAADPDYAKLVGDYLRQETAYKAQQAASRAAAAVDQAKFDRLSKSVETLEATLRRLASQPGGIEPPPPPLSAPAKPLPNPVPNPAAPLPTPQSYAPDMVGAAPPPPNAPGRADATVAILRNKCAACHSGDADKGGGVAFFGADGAVADLTPHFDAIIRDLASNRMPKGGGPKLTPDEKMAVFAGLAEFRAPAPGQ